MDVLPGANQSVVGTLFISHTIMRVPCSSQGYEPWGQFYIIRGGREQVLAKRSAWLFTSRRGKVGGRERENDWEELHDIIVRRCQVVCTRHLLCRNGWVVGWVFCFVRLYEKENEGWGNRSTEWVGFKEWLKQNIELEKIEGCRRVVGKTKEIRYVWIVCEARIEG